jgi:hypothetical protein
MYLIFLQAKSLGHGISGTLYLINPVSLFKYDAVSKIDRKGKCITCGNYGDIEIMGLDMGL